ncbi:hypothetical protein [Kribbella sp. NPDC050459]|uniref:hypothetical protein n=1 Tax=Kribbella sp. NPDC050459 TaxID=3155785 RepID=UPI0033E28F2A
MSDNAITRRQILGPAMAAGAAVAVASASTAAHAAPARQTASVTVVAVPAIHDLLAEVPNPQVLYLVGAYHAGETPGGGMFVHDPTVPKNLHNGGDIISATVPWDGTPATIAGFLAGTGETDPSGSGCFVRQYDMLNPYMFGCLDGTDCTASLQAFADRASNILGDVDWGVDALVSAKITFHGGTVHPAAIHGTLRLTSTYDSTDWMLEVNNFPATQIDSVVLIGKGSASIASRTNHRGLLLRDITGSVIRRVEVRYMKVQGIEVNTNAYHALISAAEIWYCGYGINTTIGQVFTFAGHTLTGGVGPAQYTEFTGVTSIPAEAVVGDSIVIGKNDYTITAIDRAAGTVTVRLWVTNEDFAYTAGDAFWCIGAGLKVFGSSTGPFSITTMTTLGCSIGYFITQLYPGFVGKLSGESNLVTVRLGAAPYTGHLGGSIGTLYAEAGRIAVSNQNVTGEYVIGNIDPMTCAQRISHGTARYLVDFDVAKGAVEAADVDYQVPAVATAFQHLDAPIVDRSVYGPAVPTTVVLGTSYTLSFSRDDFIAAGVSHRMMMFPKGGTRTVTITAGTGTTIGAAAAPTAVLVLNGPAMLFAEYIRATKNWRLSQFDGALV